MWHRFDDTDGCDGWMLTDVNAPRVAYEHLSGLVVPERILVPDILRLD